MEFDPTFTFKMLQQTEAGELVRLRWSGPLSLALVAFFDGRRFLIFLDGPHATKAPGYFEPKADARVISYGRDYTLEIDQDAAFVDMIESSYFNRPGAIFVGPTQRVLYATATAGAGIFGVLKYDLETGLMSAAQNVPNGVYFGKWKIWLPRSPQLLNQPQTPFFSFALSQIKGLSDL